MDAALLKITGVTKQFGGFTALSGVSVAIARGERFGSFFRKIREIVQA